MKFKIGSRAFFEDYSDFNPHDSDYVLIENNPTLFGKKSFVVVRTKDKEDYFCYKEMDKKEFLEFELNHCYKNSVMAVGKLLVPELVNYFNITLEDLKPFEIFLEHIDDKHKYEKVIYDAYLENNGFFLTKELRDKAYVEYKKHRQ